MIRASVMMVVETLIGEGERGHRAEQIRVCLVNHGQNNLARLSLSPVVGEKMSRSIVVMHQYGI